VLNVSDAETGELISARTFEERNSAARFHLPKSFLRWSEAGNSAIPAEPDSGVRDSWRSGTWYGARLGNSAWHPHDDLVVSSMGNRAIVWNHATGEPIDSLEGHSALIKEVAWSPDGLKIVAGADDGLAIVWDPATGERLATLEGHDQTVGLCEWSVDGRRLLTYGNHRVLVWDTATWETVRSFDGVENAVFSPDGSSVAMVYVGGSAIIVHDVRSYGEHLGRSAFESGDRYGLWGQITSAWEMIRQQPEWEEVRDLCESYAEDRVDY